MKERLTTISPWSDNVASQSEGVERKLNVETVHWTVVQKFVVILQLELLKEALD